MSSGTSNFVTKEGLRKFANNVAIEVNNQRTQSMSLAICFDTMLAVLDRRFPPAIIGGATVSEEVKAELSKRMPKPKQEVPPVISEEVSVNEDPKSD